MRRWPGSLSAQPLPGLLGLERRFPLTWGLKTSNAVRVVPRPAVMTGVATCSPALEPGFCEHCCRAMNKTPPLPRQRYVQTLTSVSVNMTSSGNRGFADVIKNLVMRPRWMRWP